VARTRIAFIDMPRMLREILDAALVTLDVSLVDEHCNGGGLLAAVDRSRASFVIVSSEEIGPVEVCKLLQERPAVKVFAVADGGLDGCLYELRPNLVAIDELSPQRLVQTILAADRGAHRRKSARKRTTNRR
jgi:acyl-CoA synthetase (AMP-forming)/AMP-acid ligase II